MFNAKELDEESGMYYYEARYYAPPTFISRDPLFEKYPTISPYAYCYNNPVNLIDPTGMEGEDTDDIIFKGKNNSSLTIKTDAIDIKINVDVDFGGNYTIADLSNVAVGFEMGGSAYAAFMGGVGGNVYGMSAMFFGGDYAGYWYDYAGVEGQGIVATSSAEASAGVYKNWFIAFNHDSRFNTPEDFAGYYSGSGFSLSQEAGIGELGLNFQKSTAANKAWTTYSLGASVSVGPSVPFSPIPLGGSVNIHTGGTTLLNSNNYIKTNKRSFF
jgi:RHS repeat-associated protein